VDHVPADRAEDRLRDSRSPARADDDEIRVLRLSLEHDRGIFLDELPLDVVGRTSGKRRLESLLELRPSGFELRFELPGNVAHRNRRERRLGEGGGRDGKPAVDCDELRVTELCLVGRPTERGQRGLRTVHSDDDPAGHSLTLYRELVAATPRVTVVDVGPRDGLQNEPDVLAPDVRAELVERLVAARLAVVEVASFVDPRRVPQMAGAEDVVAAVERVNGVVYAGLALNERGYERLAAAGLDEVRFSFGATESFNERNQNASVSESVEAAKLIVGRARADGIRSAVTISVSFGCPFEGEVDENRVLELAADVAEAGPDTLLLADTIGVGVPRQVRSLFERARELGVPIGGHFHNTRNTGYANAVAAFETGATVLDASVGGLGGCPFAPKATGNIATEDLVYLLEREGVETGIDLEGLIAVSAWLEEVLGRRLEGQLYRAGSFPPAP
jgi:isopropylmalate/homocitrate/citramalate synthase